MTTTTMPTLAAAFLVAGHVGDLWSQWAHDKETPGCCPTCCGPCAALKDLLDRGQLDDLYGVYVDHVGGGHEPWDADKGQVGRDWLTQAWSVDLGCCERGQAL